MTNHIVSSIAIACALAVTAHAGTSTISPSASTVNYGSGPYVALQGGFNAGQDTFNDGAIFTNSAVGGFGGLKAGYVFPCKGLVRPAVEFDGFYNGFSQRINAPYVAPVYGSLAVKSAAYMINGIARFNLARFNLAAFQPYAGAGIGVYTAEGDYSYTDGYFYTGGESTSWAWQIVAGADYYFTPTISVFAEYKFLNYMDAVSSNLSTQNRLGQQLAGMGVRFHF
jgi:opacity protein-like surface antigen